MVHELNFQTLGDRLPPQNIDAEEAILGGILLDPEAISRIADVLRPEAFYISTHQIIYRAALTLHSQGKPTDLMSLTSWLQDNELLEKVGGQSRLAQLVDRTISAVNIDQYASLVADKYLRRKLIQVGTEISQLGYEAGTDLAKILDQSEQKVFSITQDRPQRGLVPTSDILTDTFSDIESRSLGMVLPGISCGFYDLDAMTQGFQRSDLIIAAGRPSMGKCLAYDSEILLADGSIATIQEIYRDRQAQLLTLGNDRKFHFTQPSAFVDDGIKPVFRVITRLGRCIETTLTHPYLTLQGWRKLSELKPGDLIAVPHKLEVFGTEALPKSEIKRLAHLAGDHGDRKNAPEKTIPPIVFRLQRSHLALFLNCLFADGWATGLANGRAQLSYATVSERLARQVQHLLLRFGIIAALTKHFAQGNATPRPMWELEITDAQSIKTFISNIRIEGKEAGLANGPADLETSHYQTSRIENSQIHVGDRLLTRERLLTPTAVLDNPPLQNLANSEVYWDQIVSIQLTGYKQVYDLTIPETHNFVANDICVHNTSFVLNIARNIAAFHKLPVAVFSLEMSKEQLVYRLLSSEVEIESSRLRSGRISNKEWEPLGHAISTLSQIPIFIDDTPDISITEMRSKARRLQAEQGGALGLILVDYLQLMEGGGDNRVQELSKMTRSLKGLARELNAPVIALSQLSRGVESRTNKRPMMSDLRESGSIEQDADLILMLYRDEYYNPDTPDRGIAEIIITKHRNGPVGTVKVLFEPQFTRFRNLASPNRA